MFGLPPPNGNLSAVVISIGCVGLHESLNEMNGIGMAGGNEKSPEGILNPKENFGRPSENPQMVAAGLGGNESTGPPAGGDG